MLGVSERRSEIRLLLTLRGAFHLRTANGIEVSVTRKRSKALIALLAFSENGVRERRWIQDKLWSDRDPEKGSGSLRQELRYLRKIQDQIGSDFLQINPDTVKLNFEIVSVDIRNLSGIENNQEILEGLDIDDLEFEDWLRDIRQLYSNDDFKNLLENGQQFTEKYQTKQQPQLYISQFEALEHTPEIHDLCRGLRNELLISLSTLTDTFNVTDTPSSHIVSTSYELIGSVQRSKRIRITAHLVKVPERRTIWSGRFDEKIRSSVELQEHISRKIVEAIQERLVDGDMVGIWSRYKTSLQAWELYQTGRKIEAFHRRSTHKKAREFYNQVIELDPEFVPARVVRIFLSIDELRLGWVENTSQTFAKIRKEHEELLLNHAQEPYVKILGAYIDCYSGDQCGALKKISNAVSWMSESPELKAYHALIFAANDDIETAIAMYKQALKLTPFPPNWIRTNLGLAYLVAEDSAAEATLDTALSYDEMSVRAHIGKVICFIRRGEFQHAKTWANSLKSLQPDFVSDCWRDEKFYKNPAPIRKIAKELKLVGL